MAQAALIVGINEYDHAGTLQGCSNDANAMHTMLEINEDGSPNFECEIHVDRVDKNTLRAAIDRLLSVKADTVIFYFSGHGALNDIDGYLITSDAQTIDSGYSMRDLLARAQKCAVPKVVVILDCCFAAQFGNADFNNSSVTSLRQGMAVLAACAADQTAREHHGAGVFTSLICQALGGGAKNVLGDVTVGSVYSYVDKALDDPGRNSKPILTG